MKFFRNMCSKKRQALKTFVYNECSEVVSTLGTNEYTYSYDPIGNRTASTQNAEAKSYISNPLNQYITIQQEEQTAAPTYDADGNMLSSPSGWSFTWNAENRLVSASRGGVVVTYAYDAFGRMISKHITGAENKTITYTWDVFNIIKETENSIATYNIWGLDVDGTMQGAGGVGGLLAVAKSGNFYTPTYDANGNITEYIDVGGNVAAQYKYSAFGEIISQSGQSFTHLFSTKPYCPTTDLIEYQFRKYDPALGRWLSRDPIEEAGGLNLYAFCENSIMGVDLLGLSCFDNFLLNCSDFVEEIKKEIRNYIISLDKERSMYIKAVALYDDDIVFKSSVYLYFNIVISSEKFDSSLANKMLFKYLFEPNAKEYILSTEEIELLFNDSNNYLKIDIRKDSHNNTCFTDHYNNCINSSKPCRYKGKTLAFLANGVLGNFFINYDGFICEKNGSLSWCGLLWVDSDEYDFNPNWNHNPGSRNNLRTDGAELNVRLMYLFVKENSFTIRSEKFYKCFELGIK